ncbi:DUF5937 family protein [Leifsonia sp. A12D58]|uniref:ArsR/SmtB family transcription factor n=1 Tax=Leifsonia sp. A12D58 TaxID=3397674 RepID=UPI0039E01801
MLQYELGDAALSGIRFGISPLCELGLSLRAMKDPSRYPLQLPWLTHTSAARAELDLGLLLALVNDMLWTPDFLNPRPASPLTRIEDEFAVLEGLSTTQYLRQLTAVHPDTMPDVLTGPPRQVITRMVAALRDFWSSCFEPHWPRMRTILEADIAHRGRVIAQGGLAEMLNSVSSSVSFDGHTLHLALRNPVHRTEQVDSRGIMLVPTMFTHRASAPVEAGEPPLVMYPARGQGAMWGAEQVVNPRAVANVLGGTRASLLTALTSPASSTELGIRFGVSASAVNQHLRALRNVGLVTSTRYGHSMLYLRSPLGSALLGSEDERRS